MTANLWRALGQGKATCIVSGNHQLIDPKERSGKPACLPFSAREHVTLDPRDVDDGQQQARRSRS